MQKSIILIVLPLTGSRDWARWQRTVTHFGSIM